MNKVIKTRYLIIFIVLISSLFLFIQAPEVGAFFLPDFLKPVKQLFNPAPTPNPQLTLTSNITLTEDGDVNKNGQIDAGDMVRFSFTIDNPTNTFYKLATLNTHIQRDSLNFIHNIVGATGMDEANNNISFPNLRIDPQSHFVVSMDTRINYFIDQDKVLSTEPEIITLNKKNVLKSSKKSIKANRIKKEDIPNVSKFTKKTK